MGGRRFIIVPLSLLIAGCSTVSSGRLNNLETRVSALQVKVESLEQGSSVIEGQAGVSPESAADIKQKSEGVSGSPSTAVVAGALGDRDIQAALKNAGFYTGIIDGKIGKNTRAALREFQKANGLKVDGIAGKKTKGLLSQHLKQ